MVRLSDFELMRSLAKEEKFNAPSNNDTNGKLISTHAIPRIEEVIIRSSPNITEL
jgi:hypothetical protein